MRVPFSLRLALSLCLATTLIACDDDEVQNNGGGGFQLNNDIGDESKDTSLDETISNDSSPDVPPVVDSSSDTRPDVTPSGCQTNDNCSRTEVCCQDLSGNKSCVASDQCAFGGLCNSDNQCGGAGEVCCDLSALGIPDKVCTDQCDQVPPVDATEDEPVDQPPGPDQGPDTACNTNAECGNGLLCCADQTGSQTCKTDCLYGGSCSVDAECSGAGEECCDVSQLGIPGAPDNICTDRCPGMMGGGGVGCTNNTACLASEVCCPSFQGNSCVQSGACQVGGGLCAADTDCRNGQTCCGRGNFKICRDQCGF